jgi:hypothetical protein
MNNDSRVGHAGPPGASKSGFFIFEVPEGLPTFGPEDIQAALDAEDAEFATEFLTSECHASAVRFRP